MKYALILAAISTLTFAGPRKPLPGQAGNDDVELVASPILDREAMTQALGADIGPNYVIFRVKVTPKTDKPLRIGPDDFTMICRKDGERSQALDPGQIAGKGMLVVKSAANQPGGYGTETNGPIWGGVINRSPSSGAGAGNSNSPSGTVASSSNNESDAKENPLMKFLKEKILPDKESLEPLEGLLYFPLDAKKVKGKDLALQYKGPAGRLEMEFINPR
jgi:hypothetical protein